MHPHTLRRLAAAALATTAVTAAGAGSATAAANPSVGESAGIADVAITLVPSLFPRVVDWSTSDGTATDGSDYSGVQHGTVVFAPLQTVRGISIPIIDDTLHEGDETFDVNLSGAGLPAGAKQTVTILDDDPEPGIKVSDIDVHEADGTARFDVALTKESGLPVQADWSTADGTAQAGGDYAATSGHLTFAPGETSKPVTVDLANDAAHEDTERFALRLSNVTGASLVKPEGTATVLDDDAAPAEAPQQPPADNSTGRAVVGPALRESWPRLAYRGLTTSGWVRLAASCPRGYECGGVVSLRSGKRTVGRKGYSLESGRRRMIAIRLSRAARRALARHHRLRVVARTGGGPVLRFTVKR